MTGLFFKAKPMATYWRSGCSALLLTTALLATPLAAQFASSDTTAPAVSLGAGFRIGPLKGTTDLEDQDELLVGAFLQRSLWRHWQGELSIGYSQLTNTKYSTDMLLIDGKLLYSTFRTEELYLYVYGGLGLVDYDISTWPKGQMPRFKTMGLEAIAPIGGGVQIELTKRFALEICGGYTYIFSDQINGASVSKGSDAFWSWTIGLRIEERPRKSKKRTFLPPPIEAEPDPEPVLEEETFMPTPEQLSDVPILRDRDGDGLSDDDERQIYFTNPLMADSDNDGLFDGEEIQVYQTNPNRSDTDDGGVRDGAEVAREANPLDADDDARLIAEQMVFPRISFALNRTQLEGNAEKLLDGVVRALNKNPRIKLEVRGYTDSIGETEANLQLAEKRAQRVKDYLVERGVASARLSIKALGEANPIASNETLMGRRQNRRVELVPDL